MKHRKHEWRARRGGIEVCINCGGHRRPARGGGFRYAEVGGAGSWRGGAADEVCRLERADAWRMVAEFVRALCPNIAREHIDDAAAFCVSVAVMPPSVDALLDVVGLIDAHAPAGTTRRAKQGR